MTNRKWILLVLFLIGILGGVYGGWVLRGGTVEPAPVLPPEIVEKSPLARFRSPAMQLAKGALVSLSRPARIPPNDEYEFWDPRITLCDPVRTSPDGLPSALYPMIRLPRPFVTPPKDPGSCASPFVAPRPFTI